MTICNSTEIYLKMGRDNKRMENLSHSCLPRTCMATLKRQSLHADVTVECTSQLDANRREVVKDVEREVDLSIYRFI